MVWKIHVAIYAVRDAQFCVFGFFQIWYAANTRILTMHLADVNMLVPIGIWTKYMDIYYLYNYYYI